MQPFVLYENAQIQIFQDRYHLKFIDINNINPI
jgi:hypothetical protein